MEMFEEINEAIKKNLPAQLGDILNEQLNLLAKYKIKDIENSEKIRLLQESYDSCVKEKNKLQTQIQTVDEITKRETLVKDRELKQDLRDLEVKFSELRRLDSVKMVELVFKSPIYTKSVTGSIPVAVDGCNNGSYGIPGTVIQSQYSNTETTSVV